jgi:hypothetical protein
MILEDLPAPDYDMEDPYYGGYQARMTNYSNQANNQDNKNSGILNSVLRHLPINAARNQSLPMAIDKRGSNSSSSGGQDSDEIYAHIYSSISDATKSVATMKSKAKRSSSIPKTWRFFRLSKK